MTSEAAGRSVRSTSRPGLVLMLACAATFMAFLVASVIPVAFPDLEGTFPGTPLSQMTWVVSGFAVFFAAVLAPAGRLADVVGRRTLFLFCVAGFTVASALCAAASNVGFLVAMRALQGAMAGGMVPAALGLVLQAAPPERRVAAVGLWGAVGAIAA